MSSVHRKVLVGDTATLINLGRMKESTDRKIEEHYQKFAEQVAKIIDEDQLREDIRGKLHEMYTRSRYHKYYEEETKRLNNNLANLNSFEYLLRIKRSITEIQDYLASSDPTKTYLGDRVFTEERVYKKELSDLNMRYKNTFQLIDQMVSNTTKETEPLIRALDRMLNLDFTLGRKEPFITILSNALNRMPQPENLTGEQKAVIIDQECIPYTRIPIRPFIKGHTSMSLFPSGLLL